MPRYRRVGWIYLKCGLFLSLVLAVSATQALDARTDAGRDSDDSRPLLADAQFERLQRSMDKALVYMAGRQKRDGSFPVIRPHAEPAVTSLCVMGFLARGHVPGNGEYGLLLNDAIDYVLSCQKPNGFLVHVFPSEQTYMHLQPSHSSSYNHAIAFLMLCEVYGMIDPRQSNKIREAIEKALKVTLKCQITDDGSRLHQGGWGYIPPYPNYPADLSVASWQMMALRAAKNAGFDVPIQTITEAIDYVERCFQANTGTFEYTPKYPDPSQGMAGAGILLMSLAGEHRTPMARAAGNWLLQRPIKFGAFQFEYAAYYCTQAALQLGEPYWSRIYPSILEMILANQNRNGSWATSEIARDWSEIYTTSMLTLALGAPLQLLPIYQR